ncbi:unnamed protein product [Mytilus edulis]|uniref:Mab-21-like HhH/H2TH-like domain-containing protein n=1 Tax=Mytilus edulis TaxID=6550 RepID=A0A8S3PXM8_MYTED|nr:unnamed protein product [Mytilus edulis]
MGYMLSKESSFRKDTYVKTKEQQEEISIKVSKFIAKIIATPPLKLKMIGIYHDIYERFFGPWGRVTGSYADNLSMSTSDVDIILDNFSVNSSPEIAINNSCPMELVIFTDDDDIPSGCCWLRAYQRDAFKGKYVPSVSTSFPFVRVNGLTKQVTDAEWNLVDTQRIQICKTLPPVLLKWANRTRKTWPLQSTIEEALEQGCHVISLPSKISSDEFTEVEFRLGYGAMEKLLTESLNDCQKQCYILLKITLKEYIEPQFPEEDIVSSYVMKMLIFWMSEETDSDTWRPECLLDCLDMCLGRLFDWVESGYCPNFFIPEYNLFRTKLTSIHSNKFTCLMREIVDLKWKVLWKGNQYIMAINKDVCTKLYHCLCAAMGSEEVVTVRRQFFASADYFTERSDFALITSGSRAEGLDMGSDLDIMLLFKNVHISEERTEESFRIPNNIVMDTDECKPCFSQLKGYSCHFDSLIKLALTPHGQEYRLESERIRYLLLSFTWLFKPFHFHGPCVSDETERGLCDLTVCLRCPV